jgi:hypothetical protein
MTAREIALAHLRRWTTSAARLPPGAALLEGTLTPTTSWAIRHPETGAVFGWHADPDRLALLYWESLATDDRCELVAAAVAALDKASHRRAWRSAWRHWNRDAGARRRAVEEVVTAWVRGDRRDLDLALAALSEDPFPDDPAWLDGEDGELAEPADARLALEYAAAALVAGEVDPTAPPARGAGGGPVPAYPDVDPGCRTPLVNDLARRPRPQRRGTAGLRSCPANVVCLHSPNAPR